MTRGSAQARDEFDDGLHLTLPASVEAVPKARHRMARWLDGLHLHRDVIDDMSLAITELVTNAVEASPSDAEVRVDATYHPPDLCLEVVDQGPGFVFPTGADDPGPESLRGRGLPIVHALVDLVEVRRSNGCTKVTATRRLTPSSV